MTHWTYDPAIDAAVIIVNHDGVSVRTIDLFGAHVMIDVSRDDGRVMSIEIIGPADDTSLSGLAEFLKEEPNV
jgi:uncharacterized protein YuzE